MQGFKDGGLLSKAYAKANLNRWCACYVCRIIFEDDVPSNTPVICPNGCGGGLYKGLTLEEANKLKESGE